MTATRMLGLIGGGLLLVAAALSSAGCDGALPDLGEVIGGDVTDILDELENTVIVRVVNLTGQVVELDLQIDGLPQTLQCPPDALEIQQDVCDFPLPECPIRIEATQVRFLDTGGGFRGGENFLGDERFGFTQGTDFECGQFIFYRFTSDGSEAFVLQ